MVGEGRAGHSADTPPLQTLAQAESPSAPGWPRASLHPPDAQIEGDAGRTAEQGREAGARGWTLSGGVRSDDGGRCAAPAARSPSVITASRRPAPIRLLLIKLDVEMEMKT